MDIKKRTRLLAYLLFFQSINYFINTVLQDGLNVNISVSGAFYIIALFVGLISYLIAFCDKPVYSLIVISFFFVGTILFFVFHNAYSSLVFTNIADLAYNPSLILFLFSLPAFMLVFNDKIDYHLLLLLWVKYSRFILFTYVISFFVFRIGTASQSITYMSFSYNALPAICTCLIYSDTKYKIQIDKLLAFVSLIITVIAGSRGALLCCLTFILLVYLFNKELSRTKKIIVSAFLLVIITIGIGFYDDLLSVLSTYLESKGVYSRTLIKLANASFAKSDDRTQLWRQAMDGVKNSPFIGYGLWGDRPLVNGFVHNVFIEFICSFGYFFGGLISVVLLFGINKSLFSKNIDNDKFSVFLVAIPSGLVQLLFSGSYLTNVWFFLLCGMIISINKKSIGRQRSISCGLI